MRVQNDDSKNHNELSNLFTYRDEARYSNFNLIYLTNLNQILAVHETNLDDWMNSAKAGVDWIGAFVSQWGQKGLLKYI